MCTLVSNLRAQKNWFAIQRREWGRERVAESGSNFLRLPGHNVDRQLLGME